MEVVEDASRKVEEEVSLVNNCKKSSDSCMLLLDLADLDLDLDDDDDVVCFVRCSKICGRGGDGGEGRSRRA
jgi:hypothetical protein